MTKSGLKIGVDGEKGVIEMNVFLFLAQVYTSFRPTWNSFYDCTTSVSTVSSKPTNQDTKSGNISDENIEYTCQIPMVELGDMYSLSDAFWQNSKVVQI